MRRLLILLLAMVAFGAIVPARAAPSHHSSMAMPAAGCHDEGQCVAHVCVGCALKPAEPPVATTALSLAVVPTAAAIPRFVADHRPGFDPPPPRRLG